MGDGERSAVRKAAVFLALGAEVAGSTAGAAFLGYYLDVWLGTSPLMLLVFVVLTTVGIFWRVLRLVRFSEKDQ